MKTTRRLSGSRRAQVQVMEIITAGIIMMSAMNFIASLDMPRPAEYSTQWQYTALGEDGLRVLDGSPASDPKYRSMLDEYLCTNRGDQIGQLMRSGLDAADFQEVNFRIILVDPDEGTRLLVHGDAGYPETAEVSVAYLIMVISNDGYIKDFFTNRFQSIEPGIYEVNIQMWVEPT